MKGKLVGIILAMLLLNGCASNGAIVENDLNNQNSTTTISEENVTQAENSSETDNTESGFDFERILDNIYFDNDKIELMTTIKDWDKKYNLEFMFDSEADGMKCDAATLYNETVKIGIVFLKKDKPSINNETMYCISFKNIYDAFAKVKIDGITEGMEYSKVIDKYGEPNEKNIIKEETECYYRVDQNHFLLINFENDKVCGISVYSADFE